LFFISISLQNISVTVDIRALPLPKHQKLSRFLIKQPKNNSNSKGAFRNVFGIRCSNHGLNSNNIYYF